MMWGRVALVLCLGLLFGCEGEQHSDLQAELNEMTQGFRGKVDPLPQVRPYEPVAYQAEGEIDPFRPDRVEVALIIFTISACSCFGNKNGLIRRFCCHGECGFECRSLSITSKASSITSWFSCIYGI